MSTTITEVHARMILDCRGYPTVQVDVVAGGMLGRADVPAVPWVPRELLVHMGHDKKASEGRITFVLAGGVGKAFLTAEVAASDVLAVLEG